MENPTVVDVEAIYYPILAVIGVPELTADEQVYFLIPVNGQAFPFLLMSQAVISCALEYCILRLSIQATLQPWRRPVNVLAIIVLCRRQCGLSGCITLYLVAMAVADLLVLITDVILNRINNMYFPISFLLLTPMCSARAALLSACTDASVWLTVTFTLDRFVAICCPSLKIRFSKEKSAAFIIGTVATICILKNVPWYFAFEPRTMLRNMPYFCVARRLIFTSVGWIRFLAAHRALTPLVPMLLVILLNSITIRHIVVSGRVRRRLRAGGGGGFQNEQDPEMQSRRRTIILLFAISGSFVILWLTYIVHFLFFPMVSYNTNAEGGTHRVYILQESGVMLQLLSTCTNTAIYTLTQRRFREQIYDVLTTPCRLFCN